MTYKELINKVEGVTPKMVVINHDDRRGFMPQRIFCKLIMMKCEDIDLSISYTYSQNGKEFPMWDAFTYCQVI